MKTFDYTIKDALGIHARPAGLLVKEAKKCKSSVSISTGEKKADATKLMAVMSLGIKCGQTVTVEISGEDEDTAYNEILSFFEKNLQQTNLQTTARMLKATRNGDTKTMAEILEYAHHTESPVLSYNSEAELAAVVRLVYLEAQDTYRIEQEDKAGTGYADFVFYPLNSRDDCIVLEIKVNTSANAAIQQIKKKNYAIRFQTYTSQKPVYTIRILAVGIVYQKKR